MVGRRCICLPCAEVNRDRLRQKLRNIKRKIKALPWIPEYLQTPGSLSSRRYPTKNLSSSFLRNSSNSECPLLRLLPAEIRVKVFEYVLTDPSLTYGELSSPEPSPFGTLESIDCPVNCLWRIPGRLIAKPPSPCASVCHFHCYGCIHILHGR